MNDEYLAPREVCRILHIHKDTLFKWTHQGKISFIKTTSGQHRYPKSAVLALTSPQETDLTSKVNFCYARVSTKDQTKDLDRQVQLLSSKFPDHTIIKDIGSGINFKRNGFQTLLDQAIKGNIGEIVVTHKDRICRFGYDLFESILSKYSNGKIVVLNRRDLSPPEELTTDLATIINVFTSRLYGLRRNHQVKNKIVTLIQQERENGEDTQGKTPTTNEGSTETTETTETTDEDDDDGSVSLVL